MESIDIKSVISADDHRRLAELANHYKISERKLIREMVHRALLHYDLELKQFESIITE